MFVILAKERRLVQIVGDKREVGGCSPTCKTYAKFLCFCSKDSRNLDFRTQI
jgi:hypothetical protein